MAIMHTLFFSGTLKRRCAMNVYVPERPHSDGKAGFPVVYLLHGRSDDENSYADHGIRALCEKYEFIVVMPDGARSFYCDMVSGEKYWTFISEELPRLISVMFPVRQDRANTFAAGLSMGGYGAFKIGMSRPERFSMAASLSGAFDIAKRAARPENFHIFGQNAVGSENDPYAIAEKLVESGKPMPELFQWCGTEDSLYGENIKMRDFLREKGFSLAYSESRGNHSWPYWDEHIQDVLRWIVEKREK